MNRSALLLKTAAPSAAVLAATLAVAVAGLIPPRAVSAAAGPERFSAERAMAHLEVIAPEPRPIGSPAGEATREYLSARLEMLGLAPETQRIEVRDYYGGTGLVPVINVMARIPGTDPTGAILLMGHFDTVPETAGANDNAAAVAAVLEAGRALTAGVPLRNDVILLFTDGEEPAPRYGSTAFVTDHPWADDVRLVVNLEAIGGSGASQLVEVAGPEGALIAALARAGLHPAAASYVDDIVEMLGGSNTDLAPFRERGVAGFEFAYLRGSPIYHTPADDIASVHSGSVQHHGTLALGLARAFGDADLTGLGASDQEVFFSIAGATLVHYPAGMGVALAVAAGLALVLGTAGAVRAGRIRLRQAGAAAAWGFGAGIGCALVVAALWTGLTAALWGSRGPGDLAASVWLVALTAAALGAALVTARRLERRLEREAVAWAAVAVVWLPGLVASLLMPGSAYLFVGPALIGAIALGSRPRARWSRLASLAVVAGTVLILLLPAVDTFFQFGLPRPGNPDSQMPAMVALSALLTFWGALVVLPHLRRAADAAPDRP